ncbi:MAG: tetratricopeptide repeat protein [Chloroflexi bacterium]|nr:tetratricopeptide repeat protein [Chloroflexota bacterium]
MNQPVTRTKIVLPRRRADLLSRQRLLDAMTELLDNKLIIIAAPAGYGKTSLLIDLAHQTEIPVSWYALDPLDKDFKRFAAHLLASISQRFPAFGKQSALTLQNLPAANPDLNQLVTVIANEAYENIQEHFLIVLDDYHFVDDQEEINRFMGLFLQAMDENCHLVVASRTLLSLPDLPLMVARSQVGGLGFDQLTFQAEEIRNLIQQNYHVTLTVEEAEVLAQETEGWITGLLLSNSSKWQEISTRLQSARVSKIGLYDYLAQQVLDRQTPPVRDFLLRTSILEEFDAELCETIFGQPGYPGGESWQDLMETVLHNNLFILPVGEKGLWLRYHHLFRDFLQMRLANENPGEEARINQRLAKVYALRGEWEKAHALFRRLGDTADVIELIEQTGPVLIKIGRLSTLASWIDGLPAAELLSNPSILSLRGTVAATSGEVERSLVLFNASEKALRKDGKTTQLANTLHRRALTLYYLGDYQAALADAEEAITLVGESESLSMVKALALRAKGLSLFRLGHWSEAVDCLSEAAGIFDTLGNSENLALVQIDLGTIFQNSGLYKKSRFAYEHAIRSLEKIGDLARLATVMNNLGVLYQVQGEYELAGGLLERALTAAKQSGFIRMEALCLASIGDLYRDLDALDAAEKAYHQSIEISQQIGERFLLFYLAVAQVSLFRLRKGWEQARELAVQAASLLNQSQSVVEKGTYSLESGRLSLLAGDFTKAVHELQDACDCFQLGGQRIEDSQAHLYLGCALLQSGEMDRATSHLKQALHLSSQMESRHFLVVGAREVMPILDEARSLAGLKAPIEGLLEQVGEFEKKIPTLRRRLRRQASLVPFAPPRLGIHALGKIQVTIDGRSVSDVGWQSQAARDLFFLLLAHPEGLTKEAIGGFLWADSTLAQGKLQFKNAIYRLRHALEQDVITLDHDRYLFNHSLDYEYDVETFTTKLAQSQVAGEIDKEINLLKSGLHLYKGEYLPEAFGVWVLPERERLYQAYLHSALHLAELYLSQGEHKQALDFCQDLLAKDACLEEAHRLAMRIYAAMGNKVAVVRQFERCQHSLMDEIRLLPSTETNALFETLTR